MKEKTLPLDEMSQPHLKGFVGSCISLEKQLATMIFKYVWFFSSRLSPQIKTPVGINFMFLKLPSTLPKEWKMHQQTNLAPVK